MKKTHLIRGEDHGNWRVKLSGAEFEEAAVAKPEWGTKRICGGCGAPFYDMMRDPIACPKCGVTFDPEQMVRLKRSRNAAPDAKAKVAAVETKPKPKSAEDDLEDVAIDDSDDLDADDDDSVLVDDDDDDDDLDEIVDGVGKEGADD